MKRQTLTLQNEMWFLRRLYELGCGMLDEGDTTTAQRCANVRRAIFEKGIRRAVLGRGPEGKSAIVEDVFERLYGEPLEGAAE